MKCLLCGRNAKYTCDGGCRDDEVAYCGYCSRRKIVIWIGHAMEQRLCAVCALREEDDARRDGIFDARYYSVSDFQSAQQSVQPTGASDPKSESVKPSG